MAATGLCSSACPKEPKRKAVPHLSFRLRAGAMVRTLGRQRLWPTRWLGSAYLGAYPVVPAMHRHGLHVQLRQGRSSLRPDVAANGQTELPWTPIVISPGEHGRDRALFFGLPHRTKTQGCAAFVVPAARWCNGANPRPPALIAYPMAGFRLFGCLPRRSCNAPPRPARPTAPRPILLRTNVAASIQTELSQTPIVIPMAKPSVDTRSNADGLACGGRNRQPGMPHPVYRAKPPYIQRTDERRGGLAHGGGFGLLRRMRQRVATEQASRSTLGTWVHSKCHAPAA
ncbi:hypothetical protein [Parapedobacter sp. 10938]|uniref:hypothetical protein n=1 Tax=Parapedobacter flavus TaxID=3110225 RepID=UPI002DB88CFE|nr:hypothetical protein [Parapedobacter sp. 10938]MEC3880956.1 hypothetical protein [Parapedobacter sp. 10938]